jgi:hypothetical protein
VAWRKPPSVDPLASMPAELAEFDAREWALPGEFPDGEGHMRGDWQATWDYIHCHRRYCDATTAWFAAHPDANFLDWINSKRARRRAGRHAE